MRSIRIRRPRDTPPKARPKQGIEATWSRRPHRRPTLELDRLIVLVQPGGARSRWLVLRCVAPTLLTLSGRPESTTTVNDLTDDSFGPALRQKGVDMRIGLDIASITLKRQANVIILVAGDADFVPAAKLARREGVHFTLDPLGQNVSEDLLEHIAGLRSGFSP